MPFPTFRSLALLIMILVLGVACRRDDEGSQPTPQLTELEQVENRIIELVNAHRAALQRPALAGNGLMRD